jgi:lipoate-protein ligase A
MQATGGRLVAWQTAAEALIAGFQAAYALELQYGTLSETELNESSRLSDEKYNDPAWTNRR